MILAGYKYTSCNLWFLKDLRAQFRAKEKWCWLQWSQQWCNCAAQAWVRWKITLSRCPVCIGTFTSCLQSCVMYRTCLHWFWVGSCGTSELLWYNTFVYHPQKIHPVCVLDGQFQDLIMLLLWLSLILQLSSWIASTKTNILQLSHPPDKKHPVIGPICLHKSPCFMFFLNGG